MNKALVICSNYLPVRNGGTIRCEKLVKYLPDFLWQPVVLTKRIKNTKKFECLDGAVIYRTRGFDLVVFLFVLKNKIFKFFGRTKNENQSRENFVQPKLRVAKRRKSEYFMLPDSDIFWALFASLNSLKIIKNENPAVILSSGPNHSVHIVGYFIKKFFNKKWIVEFRDPWTMNPFRIEKPFKLLEILDSFLEKIVIKNADFINVTSIEYKNQFIDRYRWLNEEKIFYIPNGYDPEDFQEISTPDNGAFTIVHSGNFYQQRSSANFIASIIYLFENKFIEPNKILVKFVGVLDEEGRHLIESCAFKDRFVLTGTVSHERSIFEMRASDLLLLVPGPGVGTMPGKFYEYLAAEKPIFCLAQEGPTKSMIEQHKIGVVCDSDEIAKIGTMLIRLMRRIETRDYVYPCVDYLKNRFNRRVIAEQMVSLFDL